MNNNKLVARNEYQNNEWSASRSSLFTPRARTYHSLNKRLFEPPSRSGSTTHKNNVLFLPGLEPRIAQSVAYPLCRHNHNFTNKCRGAINLTRRRYCVAFFLSELKQPEREAVYSHLVHRLGMLFTTHLQVAA